jgi:Xaa-Pro aminopeptidase
MSRLARARTLILTAALLCPSLGAVGQDRMPVILSMRERADLIDRWLETRFRILLPELMRREKIDMWVVIAREYNEDPVIRTMLPASWLSARRRTVLVFFDRGPTKGVERLAIARYDVGSSIKGMWDPEKEPDQWKRLAQVIEERDPERIAVDRSPTFALADGLTATEAEAFDLALPETYRSRVVSAERLAIGWLETRLPEEMDVYPSVVKIARAILSEGLSERVIQPGATTTTDVEWWYRDRIAELRLDTWFHPTVSVQRNDSAGERGEDFSSRPGETVILPGDLLHVDFGITYLRLNTDTQMHAYVLRPGESEAPPGLREALSTGNRLQDILTGEIVTGRSGNEVLAAALERARKEGIEATIYTHPIGFHGHAAGPTIGLWDQQGGVPGAGDYAVHPNTAYSIELNAAVPIPEWNGKKARIMLEEDAFFDGRATRYIDPRMERLLLIPRPRE